MDHLVFDTRYTGDGFCFESAEFPQGNVMAALWMGRAPGRRPSCALGLSDRRGCCSSFASLVVDAEEAERELARFLDVVALRREAGGLAPCCCLS